MVFRMQTLYIICVNSCQFVFSSEQGELFDFATVFERGDAATLAVEAFAALVEVLLVDFAAHVVEAQLVCRDA